MKIETLLRSLGYRPLMHDRIYAKPFGTSLILYDLDKNKVTTLFKDTVGADRIWNSDSFKKEDFVANDFYMFIMNFEANTKVDISQYYVESPYWFSTIEEIVDL